MSALGNLMGLFTGEPALESQQQARAATQAGFTDASKYLTDNTGKAVASYDTASGRWLPLQGEAKGGYDAYADASGANGPEGLARARAAYESTGAYGTPLKMSNDEIMRRFAGTGLTSNNLNAVAGNTADLLQKGYFQYADKLAPWLQQANTVAGGLSGIDTGTGNLWNTLGQNLATARTGQAAADAASYGKEGDIKMAAGNNLFQGIMGGLKLAGNIIAPGSGTLLGAAGNKLIPTFGNTSAY